MAIDSGRIQAAVVELLAAIGENPEREGLLDTPRRVAESYAEFFAGVGLDATDVLRNTVPVGQDDPGVVVVRDIAIRSVCEHHLLPFLGTAHIAYAPANRVIGLGSLPRAVGILAARPQVQERLTEQIASAIDEALNPHGVLVVIDAAHGCVTMRGPRQIGSTTVTLAARGRFDEPAARAEALALIGFATPATSDVFRSASGGTPVVDSAAVNVTTDDSPRDGAPAPAQAQTQVQGRDGQHAGEVR